jgi:glucan phosphoethanolaminetransferase (alkaline phosphatase superfamily)
MLEQFEIYINAQKTIANYMLALGLILISGAILIQFVATNSLFFGLKVGLLVFGLFSLVGGYSYKLTEANLQKSQTAVYQSDVNEFHQVEKDRMQKVVKNFPVIQLVFVGVIIAALAVNILLEKPVVNGILYALVIFLIGNMIIESVSKQSIHVYFEQLSTIN